MLGVVYKRRLVCGVFTHREPRLYSPVSCEPKHLRARVERTGVGVGAGSDQARGGKHGGLGKIHLQRECSEQLYVTKAISWGAHGERYDIKATRAHGERYDIKATKRRRSNGVRPARKASNAFRGVSILCTSLTSAARFGCRGLPPKNPRFPLRSAFSCGGLAAASTKRGHMLSLKAKRYNCAK